MSYCLGSMFRNLHLAARSRVTCAVCSIRVRYVVPFCIAYFACVSVYAQEHVAGRRADSVAMRVYQAHGGAEVWEALPFLGFTYSVIRQQETLYTYRHLWNRRTGQYRLELPGPASEPYVILFNVHTGLGTAHWNGSEIPNPTLQTLLERARDRFANDTFWLLAPLRLFDPGVRRSLVPDSTGEEYDVLHLTFAYEGVGPGREYWLDVDRATSRLRAWRYRAAHDGPNSPLRAFDWTGYEVHTTPWGPLVLSTLKRAVGRSYGIVTAGIATPLELDPILFADPVPLLTPVDSIGAVSGGQ